MTYRKKVLGLHAFIFLAVAVLVYLSYWFVLHEFSTLDNQIATMNIQRANNSFDEALDELDRKAIDYAKWDDTYNFTRTRSAEYLKANYADLTLTHQHINVVLICDETGRALFFKTFNWQHGRAFPAESAFLERILSHNRLLHHSDIRKGVRGFLVMPQGLLMVASQPILTNEDKGPARGALVFGRLIDAEEIGRFCRLTQLKLRVDLLDDPALPGDVIRIKPDLLSRETSIQPLSPSRIAGFHLIRDVSNRPCAVLRVEMERNLFEQGLASRRWVVVSFLAVMLISAGMLTLLFDRWILGRMLRLNRSIIRIAQSGDSRRRVEETGNDELSNVARSVNRMLDALALAQQERHEAEQRYEDKLRTLASKLSLAEAQERRRLAVQLHDGLGQFLAVSKMSLAMLKSNQPPGPLAQNLGKIHDLVDQAITVTRSLTFDLSPPILYELGLEPAVEWLIEHFRSNYGLRVDYDNDHEPKPLCDDLRLVLFQSTRELLFNVVKHSGRGDATLSIRRQEDTIIISVQDTGIGFDVEHVFTSTAQRESFGLFSIRERLSLLAGRLEIQSTPGQRTLATLIAPLAGMSVQPGEEKKYPYFGDQQKIRTNIEHSTPNIFC